MPAPLLFVTDPRTGELLRRRWRLQVVAGDDVGLSADVHTTPALVGAAPAAQLVLSDDTVSRYHLEVEVLAEGARLRDLDSTNGTFIGEARIREDFIGPHRIFRVGQTDLQLLPEDEPIASEIDTDPRDAAPGRVVELAGVVAAAERSREILRLLRRVAPSLSSVTFLGEPGVGKARLARLTHDLSPRKHAPFIALNLRSLADPAELAERLFGRGARPNPLAARPGCFEAARGGTLFLESVEHLPAELEPALIHAIRTGEVQRRGEDKKHRTDVRLMASAAAPLESFELFSQSLAQHLCAVRVPVPPLRERPDDLRPLAELFLAELSKQGRVGEASLALLAGAPLPQNADQLRRLLTRAFIDPTGLGQAEGGDLPRRLRRALIADNVARLRGHVSRAARELGFSEREVFADLAALAYDLDALAPHPLPRFDAGPGSA